MKSAIFCMAACCAFSASAERPALQTASEGTIQRHYINSPQLEEEVTVDVWLPPKYDSKSTERYPVLYMHDGQNLFDANTTWNHQAWEMDSVTGSLVNNGNIKAPVIVGIHSVSDTRVGDLMPENALTAEMKERIGDVRPGTNVRGNKYASFVVNTLKPTVDSLYNTKTDAANTFVMGSSMGGLMSMYLMLEYPDIFGGGGWMSTHWVGSIDYPKGAENPFGQAMYNYIEKNLPSSANHIIYLDRGSETIDAFYDYWDDRIYEMIVSKGYTPGENVFHVTAPGAAHEESAWKERVAIPLRFLLHK